jgi:hypothetical protein
MPGGSDLRHRPSIRLGRRTERAVQARDRWGHIGATFHRRITDNSGQWRSTDPAAQPALSVIIAGRSIGRILSRTEEVVWGLGPRRVRVATVQQGHRRSPAVTNGSEEPQVAGPAAQAAGITQTRDSDCGPEGRGSSSSRSPYGRARNTPPRCSRGRGPDSLSHRGRNPRPGRGQPSSRVMLPGLAPRR